MSGKKFMTIAVTITYCLSVLGTLALTLLGKADISVFLGVFGGFGAIVMYIVKSYYDKDKEVKNGTS